MAEEISLELLNQYVPEPTLVLSNFVETLPILLIISISIALYGFIIYNFYRFVAKKDVFELEHKTWQKKYPSLSSTVFGILKYGIVFPFVVAIWFSAFSILLFLMAKSLSLDQVLIMAVVSVSAIRLTSYYSEELSQDFAKIIPLTLLAIAISDPTFFSVELLFERVSSIGLFIVPIMAYLAYLILMEWVLRILHVIHLEFS